jgi:hypothetical protein
VRASLSAAVDLLRDGVLVLAETLVQLVDRLRRSSRLELELLERTSQESRALVSSSSRSRTEPPLLVDRGVQLVGLRGDTPSTSEIRWRMRCSRVETAPEARSVPFEIGLPGPQPFLDALLDGGDELRHPARRAPAPAPQARRDADRRGRRSSAT